MSQLPPPPRTLDAWLEQLKSPRLPITVEQQTAVRRVLTDSRKSLRDIALAMQDCPPVALAIMREANQPKSALGEPASSLETAIGRVGLQRCERLLAGFSLLGEPQIPQALRQLQLISLHACQQANGLFAGRLARLWQDIHWGSLLFLAPLWPLAARHPELFARWERRVLAEDQPAAKVEHELLGVSLPRLCLALAEHWQLPQWVIDGYRLLVNDRRLLVKALRIARDSDQPLRQRQHLDADPALQRWLTQPGNCIVLANALALSSNHNWSCQHHLRWQRLSALYLDTPLPALQQLIHQQAVLSARQYSHPPLWHPAEALLWPWTDCRLKLLLANRSPAAPPAPPLSWKEQCSRLLAQPSAFSNVLQLTQCATQALAAAGLQRVLLLTVDSRSGRLLARQSAGLPAIASELQIDPSQSQVIRRLLGEAGQLRLSPANKAQVSALLPGSLKALFGGDHLILRSLASNGRVIMLLVVDQGGQPFSEPTLEIYGKTLQCIERGIASFVRRGR